MCKKSILNTDNYKIKNFSLNNILRHIDDDLLKDQITQLIESEEKRERWEREKKRRYEISLDSDARAIIIIEYQLTRKDNSLLYNITKENLYDVLSLLSKKEFDIIQQLYFFDKTERDLAREQGVSQVTIHKHKIKILKKLHTCLLRQM